MQRSFENTLRKDILKRFISLSVLVTSLFFVCFILSLITVQDQQLRQVEKSIEHTYEETKVQSKSFLHQLGEKEAISFFNGNKNERRIFTKYYAEAPASSQSMLLFINLDGQIVFSSQEERLKSSFLPGYLQLVIQNQGADTTFERVTFDGMNHSYYLIGEKVYDKGELLGYVVLCIDGTYFLSSVETQGSQFILASKFQHVLTASSHQFVTEGLSKVKEDTFQHRLRVLDGRIYSFRSRALSDELFLYSYVSLVPISAVLVSVILFIVLVSIILIAESIRLSKNVAHKNSLEINELVLQTQLVTKGYATQVRMQTQDEFQYLGEQINRMLRRLNELYHNTLDLEKEKLTYERMLLEAQFNPHFLYNTLETIRVTSYYDPKLTDQMILCLNRILRYSIQNQEKFPSLKEDLSIFEDYLNINKIRFEKFDYALEIDPKLWTLAVPKLCLLPLVENALKYGMQVRNDLQIRVRIYQQGQDIFFEVWDNGPGFSQKALEIIEERRQNKKLEHGLLNVARRLQIFYKTVDMKITRDGDWTKVMCLIRRERDV